MQRAQTGDRTRCVQVVLHLVCPARSLSLSPTCPYLLSCLNCSLLSYLPLSFPCLSRSLSLPVDPCLCLVTLVNSFSLLDLQTALWFALGRWSVHSLIDLYLRRPHLVQCLLVCVVPISTTCDNLRVDRVHDQAARQRAQVARARTRLHIGARKSRVHVHRPALGPAHGPCMCRNQASTEAIVAALAQSGLPNTFWAEAMTSFVHVWNRLPVQSTAMHAHKATPFELWYKRKPDVAHLRSWGCRAYVHV